MLNFNRNIHKDSAQQIKISDNLKKNLTYLIKKYDIDNDALAKCTGIASSTIASLRSRAGNPTILTLQALADFFNISIDHLINQDCSALDLNAQSQKDDLSKSSVLVPIIHIEQVINWPFAIDKKLNSNFFVNTNNDINNLCFALRLNSEVLMPFYQKNTVFIVDPNKEPVDGNIVVVALDEGNKVTFRQLFIDAQDYYFKPINHEFGGMQLASDFKIYGVVVRALQNFQ